MKLLGRDISAESVMRAVAERLAARGLGDASGDGAMAPGVEARVDPFAFNLDALSAHADSTRGIPVETHRAGVGRLVVVAKKVFRASCQVFINEALGRQTVFNGHVRDSYAQLAAEVRALRAKVSELQVKAPVAAAEDFPRPRFTPPLMGPMRNARATPPEQATKKDVSAEAPRVTAPARPRGVTTEVPEPPATPEAYSSSSASAVTPPAPPIPRATSVPATSEVDGDVPNAPASEAANPGKKRAARPTPPAPRQKLKPALPVVPSTSAAAKVAASKAAAPAVVSSKSAAPTSKASASKSHEHKTTPSKSAPGKSLRVKAAAPAIQSKVGPGSKPVLPKLDLASSVAGGQLLAPRRGAAPSPSKRDGPRPVERSGKTVATTVKAPLQKTDAKSSTRVRKSSHKNRR